MPKNINKIEKPAAEMGENTNNLSKRIWTADETKAFLDAYGKRRFEFENARLKKFAMKNVLEDLTSLGVLTQVTTEEMMKVKIKNLIRAYKTAIDQNKRTGESFLKAPFLEQMDEIFGAQPIIKNNHAINVCGEAIQGLPMGKNSFRQPESTKSTSACPEDSNSNVPNQIDEPQPESSPSTSRPAASNLGIPSGSRRCRLTSKEKYYQMKERKAAERNQILKEYTTNKLKKMDEAERAKEARLERKEKLLRELFNKP